MPRGFKALICLLSLFLLLAVSPASAEERSFAITEVDIVAIVDSNGNMQVTEKDTYRFDGAFNGILVDLNAAGSDGIEQFAAYEIAAEGDVPLEFEQSVDGDRHAYKVYSQSADTMKQFRITYTVKNVVQVYADTAELYWKFFDETNANALGAVKLAIELPEGIAKDEVAAFGHGPLDGTVEIGEGGAVLLRAASLPANRMLEARVLFPVGAVPGSTKINDKSMRELILERERNGQAEESSNDYTVPYAAALLLANLAVGFTIYARYRKHARSDWQGDDYRDLPSDAAPAVVSFLLDTRIEARDLLATLFDLARRKYLVMEKLSAPKTGKGKHDYSFRWINPDVAGLLPHEKMLRDWFFQEIGSENSVTYSEIRLEASLKADFPKKWAEWQGRIREAALERHYFKTNSGIYRWILLAFIVQFFGLGFMAPEDWNWLMFCAIPLPFFVPKRYQRTASGQTEFAKWKGFERYLRAYGQLEKRDTLAADLWDHYFVYAIPLGVAKKLIKDTRVAVPGRTGSTYYDTAFYCSVAVSDFDRLNKLFNETVSESTSSSSSSSDSGDSFSSGGGDGGGGGGRGAF